MLEHIVVGILQAVDDCNMLLGMEEELWRFQVARCPSLNLLSGQSGDGTCHYTVNLWSLSLRRKDEISKV
ncbi:hypothetical protein AgCh_019192 [Apium graveolens]